MTHLTTDSAYVRLHGRNHESWNHNGPASSSRFDYRYSGEELAGLNPEIRKVAAQARKAHVLFNTNYQDQGQANARLMRQLLT